ncbi:MAG: glycosyltransferase [Parcubacteria group bacterium]|jgi:glycosyltransferase involved in cell wall biosynthesis
MKIGIFTNNYLPNPYGVTCSIESFRAQFEKMGHEVFVFASKWKGYADNNPHVFRYPSMDIEFKFRFPLAVPYSRKIDKIIANLDLDIIHSQHPNLLGAAAAKWARKKKIPLVFTWHTLYDQYAHFFPIIPEKLAAWWAIRNARNYANKADYVITPTQSVIPIIQKWGVTNPKIKAIATGVEEDLFKNADGGKIREKFGIKDDEIVLFLNCRLTSEKNTEFLFRSIIPLLKKNKGIKILSIGGGYLKNTLQKMAENAGVGVQVVFAGEVPKEEVKDYYAASDIFVYASKSETQGMIITEAMYMGLPVVAVNATGICDLVENNINGFLVSEKEDEFASAVNKLISDADLRKKFGEMSAKIAREKYTDKICTQILLDTYKEAIQSKFV